METILIGSDHAGFVLKEHLRRRLESAGFCVKDYGTCSEESMDIRMWHIRLHVTSNAERLKGAS